MKFTFCGFAIFQNNKEIGIYLLNFIFILFQGIFKVFLILSTEILPTSIDTALEVSKSFFRGIIFASNQSFAT